MTMPTVTRPRSHWRAFHVGLLVAILLMIRMAVISDTTGMRVIALALIVALIAIWGLVWSHHRRMMAAFDEERARQDWLLKQLRAAAESDRAPRT